MGALLDHLGKDFMASRGIEPAGSKCADRHALKISDVVQFILRGNLPEGHFGNMIKITFPDGHGVARSSFAAFGQTRPVPTFELTLNVWP